MTTMRTNIDATCATCHAPIRLMAGGYEPHDCPHNPTAGVNDGQGPAFPDGADDAPEKSKGAADCSPASRPAPAVSYGIRPDCPTCTWPNRETVNMACPTCGEDYGR